MGKKRRSEPADEEEEWGAGARALAVGLDAAFSHHVTFASQNTKITPGSANPSI
jgi:hypothetical protein